MTIGNHTRGKDSYFRCNVKHVTDRIGYDETIGDLALGDDYGGVGTAEGYAREARGGGGGFEGVFHLVETALGGEDGDVVVVVAIAGHFEGGLFLYKII